MKKPVDKNLAATIDGAVNGQSCLLSEIPEAILDEIMYVAQTGDGLRMMACDADMPTKDSHPYVRLRHVLMHSAREIVYYERVDIVGHVTVRPFGETEREELRPKRRVALVS